MEIIYDGKKKLTIDGVEHNVDDIYAFDIANHKKQEHLRIVKKQTEVELLSSENQQQVIDEIRVLNKQLQLAGCSQFAMLDYVVVNMDKIRDVSYGKDFIMVEFDDRSFTKKIDKVSKSAFLKKYDNYFAGYQNNAIR